MDAIHRQFKDGASMTRLSRKHSLPKSTVEFIIRMKYKSKAHWPAIVAACHGASISEETHDTKEQAEAVCQMLERDGLGGDKQIFPVKTWVESSNKSPIHAEKNL